MLYMGKKLPPSSKPTGFALPTVLIASVVMLIVLLASVSATVAIRTALVDQYYNKLAATTEEAGLAYVKACLFRYNGTVKWTSSKPLKTGTDCSGNYITSCGSDAQSCHWVLSDNNIRSNYEIGCPNADCTPIVGSDGSVASSYSVTSYVKVYKTSDVVAGNFSSPYKSITKTLRSRRIDSPRKITEAGLYNTCAIWSDGRLYCWGANYPTNISHPGRGQLGIGKMDVAQSYTPLPVSTEGVLKGKKIVDVAVNKHVCAIDSDGKAYCWGENNSSGKIGNGKSQSDYAEPGGMYFAPQKVDDTGALNLVELTQISVGENNTCAIDDNNNAYCWGLSVGDNVQQSSNVPVKVNITAISSMKIVQVSSGGSHTCVLAKDNTDFGKVYCWGSNSFGQLGNGNNTYQTIINLPVTGDISGKNIKQISSGLNYSCAVDVDGKAYCWGKNYDSSSGTREGFLGNGTNINSNIATAVKTDGALLDKNISMIAAGDYATCAIDVDGKAYCWGENASPSASHLGLGNSGVEVNYLSPQPVVMTNIIGKLVSIDIGTTHACAIDEYSNVYCWGAGYYGQLGIGPTSNTGGGASSNIPVRTYFPTANYFNY